MKNMTRKRILCCSLASVPPVVPLSLLIPSSSQVIDTATKLFLILELGDYDMHDFIAKHEKVRHTFSLVFGGPQIYIVVYQRWKGYFEPRTWKYSGLNITKMYEVRYYGGNSMVRKMRKGISPYFWNSHACFSLKENCILLENMRNIAERREIDGRLPQFVYENNWNWWVSKMGEVCACVDGEWVRFLSYLKCLPPFLTIPSIAGLSRAYRPAVLLTDHYRHKLLPQTTRCS